MPTTTDQPAPLATAAQMTQGPYGDLVRDYSPTAIDDLMLAATREVESHTDRRLAPFTGLVETTRIDALDLDDMGTGDLPLPMAAQMGIDYARTLGLSQLGRHVWLSQFPPRYQDLWATGTGLTGLVSSIQIYWPYQAAPYSLAGTQWQHDVDTGHVRFLLGTFAPMGSTAYLTYSGGYTTVPADLARACIYVAADIALSELDPAQRPALDLAARIDRALKPWCRE